MPLTVLLSSTLRNFVPGYDPATGVVMEVKEGTTVAEICQALKVPAVKVKIVMVDGRSRKISHGLLGNERVALFPPVGGG